MFAWLPAQGHLVGYLMPRTSWAIAAAFCTFDRRLPLSGRPRQLPMTGAALSFSQQPGEPPELPLTPPSAADDDTDWFMDGREAARQLKMELGLDGVEEDDGSSAEQKYDESGRKTSASDALESGRATARELLRSMGMAEEIDSEEAPVTDGDAGDALQAQSEETKQSTEDPCFNLPARKSHCMTVCFVPPPSATAAWEKLTEARRECKDPGFYRWPPHANILYPFLEPVYAKDGEESRDVQRSKFREELASHLANAAEQCKPFDVTIDSFGTFGGKQRGVLWAYPKSRYAETGGDDEGEEPLIALQQLLEEQFPMCSDQRKVGGVYRPHMTISHYATNDDAAKERVEAKWEKISFHVPEIYLLERKGDDGQFKIAATIPLGPDSQVALHDPPVPFPAMPEAEEEWVYNERMAMKDRRQKGNKRRRRRGGRSKGNASDEDKSS